MRVFSVMGLIFAVVFCALVVHAKPQTQMIPGTKYPNSPTEGRAPVTISVLSYDDADDSSDGTPDETPRKTGPQTLPPGFNSIVPYVLRSPDQDEAGSCLYMSLTGIAEMWLARLNPKLSRKPDGPIDLSERYLMNFAKDVSDKAGVENWKTDSIYLFNAADYVPRNIDYRFTKGWFKQDEEGDYVKAKAKTKDAKFGTQYNWIDERKKMSTKKMVKVPNFRREVIYADPDSNQWNTGVMPDDIIERIKTALNENQAPVQVLYNHFGYWHAAVIVGYDDEADNLNCQFVHKFLEHMKNPSSDEPSPQPEPPTLPPEEPLLMRKSTEVYEKTMRAYERGGGCHPKGVFYVRDSIYADKTGPVYRYDPKNPKANAPYTKKLVMIEYDWVRYMANHAVQITVDAE